MPTHTGAARGKRDDESSQHVPGLRNINLVARKKYILQAAKSIVLGGALNKSHLCQNTVTKIKSSSFAGGQKLRNLRAKVILYFILFY